MIASALSFVSTSRLLNALAADETRTLMAAQAYAGLAAAYRDQETGVRGYLLTGRDEFLEPFTRGHTEEAALYGELVAATAGRPEARRPIEAVRSAAATWQTDYALPALRLGPGSSASGIDDLRRGKSLFDALRDRLTELETVVAQPDRDLAAEVNQIVLVRFLMLLLVCAVLVVAVLVSLRLVSRWISAPLERLVTTARTVEAGGDVPFVAQRRDEIGDLGAALERMRLRMRREQRESASTSHQSSVVNRFTELAAFLQADAAVASAILEAMEQLVTPDRGVVHISNRSRERAVAEATRGDVAGEVLSLKILDSCPGIRRGTLYVTPDVGAPLSVRCPILPAERGTVACIPLTALGEVVGAVHLGWDAAGALPLEQRSAVTRIADHSALSIANRRLVDALQGMATTDARTGLANSRAFDEALAETVERQRRTGSADPFSVLLLDLDDFKAFNDRHGHPAGDAALRTFAGILTGALREGDLAARYGGEEFAVLLPGLDAAGAREIAERIRARTEMTIVALGPGQAGRLTVSIGVGTGRDDGVESATLLRSVDAALYRAKLLGRNRVVSMSDAERPDDDVTRVASA